MLYDINKAQDQEIVNPETYKFKRAISDPQQGFEVCEQLINDNKDRQFANAEIARKLNDAQPYNQQRLKESGQNWRNNRSTGFMSSLVARMMPPYKQTIEAAKTFTNSYLRDEGVEAKKKAEVFQTEVTKTIRKWAGFDDFCTRIIFEDIAYGQVASYWTDEIEWRPSVGRNDEAFFPEGNPQLAQETPVWLLKQSWMIYEAAAKLENPKASEDAGWNLEELVKAINRAHPKNPQSALIEDLRNLQDAVRDKSLGSTYSSGVRVINIYHLFAQEANSKVSHYIYSVDTKQEIFSRHDRFDSMDECLALFAVETGDGKWHGSKGAGRRLYNTHVAIEQARNLAADNFYISGLVMLKATEKAKTDVQLTVTHPCIVVPEGYDVIDQKPAVDVNAFISLDRYYSTIAETQVGAFLPTSDLNFNSGQSKPTASQINYVASIEQQIRNSQVMRFWGQFQRMIWTIQKRICSADNIREANKILLVEGRGPLKRITAKLYELLKSIGRQVKGDNLTADERIGDRNAVDCVLNMMRKGLSVEEIFELTQCPAFQGSVDFTPQKEMAIDAVVSKYTGDPAINQNELKNLDISTKLGPDLAKSLILPVQDNTDVQESVRMQLMELTSLLDGEPIPISPRDNDIVHMDVIKQKTPELIDKIMDLKDEKALSLAKNVMGHFDQHLSSAITKKMDKMKISEFTDFSQKVKNMLTQAIGQASASIPGIPEGTVPGLMPPKDMANGPDSLNETEAINLMQAQTPQPILPSEGLPLSRGEIPMQPLVGQ